mmetsp:Transcript_10048/g.30918  ORF Transcript_10048/g.30918 Transcript_10048/m.30918 type:complete len:161 (+) Transcript_10048:44-526(+)
MERQHREPSAGGKADLKELSVRELNVVAEHRKRVEMEVLGEAILTAKHQSVEFDRKRQTNREALAGIRRLDPTPAGSGKELYYCIGDLFIKVPRTLVEKQIRLEQQQIDEELDVLRADMKQKISQIADLEKDPRAGVRSFNDLSGVHPSQLHSNLRSTGK